VINTNLYLISHRFQVIANYWSDLHFQQGIQTALVRGEPLNSGTRKLGLRS